MKECVTHHFACDCREAKIASLLLEIMASHADSTMADYNECDKDPCDWCRRAKEVVDRTE